MLVDPFLTMHFICLLHAGTLQRNVAGRFFVEIFVNRILPFLRHLAIAGNLQIIRAKFAGYRGKFAGYSRVFAGSAVRKPRAATAPLRGVFAGRGPRMCATLVCLSARVIDERRSKLAIRQMHLNMLLFILLNYCRFKTTKTLQITKAQLKAYARVLLFTA
jgi:hypothetical protein